MARNAMTCRDVVELATEHFEAALPAGTSERFVAHVAACAGCQTFLRQLRVTVDSVHTVAGADPSALIDRYRGRRDADSP